MSRLADTLLHLLEVPSETGHEGRICTTVAERLLPAWGMDAVHRLGNALVVGRRTDRPLITLYGHLDTVPEQDGNGTPRVEDGLVFGLGATDMKAGLAVMIHLLEDPAVREGPYDVVGVFYDREEGSHDDNGLEDVLERAEWLLDSEFAVVLEPTDLRLELGCNGSINAVLWFDGRAAHSARPWLGVNAITKAGRWLDELHERAPAPVEVGGLEFREVFSVTMARGGVARNVIPASFEVNLNYRFPPVYSVAEAEARLRRVADAADRIDIIDRAPPATIDTANPHLTRLGELVTGGIGAKQGWTDVARLTSRGVAAANYGPGITATAHRPDEHVPLQNLDRVFATLQAFLTE